MVVPTRAEAAITIRQAVQEVAQLNEGHAFSYSRDELVDMLDAALAAAPPARAESTRPTPAVGLHGAALQGDLERARAQIAAGADLNARDESSGSTALIIASTFGRTEVARALIDAGADVNRQNNEGATALFSAALFCRVEIVEALLAAGADREIRNGTGATALDVVAAPFESVRGVYDFLGATLGPYGLQLDYERIRATRPRIAEMLRQGPGSR
jgi:hypothetical protein